MNKALDTLIIVAGLIAFETTAQTFLQLYVKKPYKLHYYLGVISYALVGVLYYYLLNVGEGLAVANSYFGAGSAIGVTLLGWLYFKQGLTAKQVAGILIIIFGSYLL